MSTSHLAILAAAASLAFAATARADERTIVLAEVPATAPDDAAVFKAVSRGVKRAIPDAAVADASLADSAFILGCDPGADACRDDVAAQLGYERLVIVSRRGGEVSVVTRAPSGRAEQRFAMASNDDAGLTALEADVAARLAPAPADGSTATSPATSTAAGPMPRGALYLGAGGVVAMLVGVTMWGLASSTQGDIDDAPTVTLDDLQHLRDLEDRGQSYATAGNILVVVGAGAAVAAGIWIWRSRSERAPAMQLTPAATPGGAALVLGGAW